MNRESQYAEVTCRKYHSLFVRSIFIRLCPCFRRRLGFERKTRENYFLQIIYYRLFFLQIINVISMRARVRASSGSGTRASVGAVWFCLLGRLGLGHSLICHN